MPTPEEHAILSASGSERWLNCPGSIRLTRDLPPRTTDYAEAGRLAHEIAEYKVRAKLLEEVGTRAYKKKLTEFEKRPGYEVEMASCTDEYFSEVERVYLSFSERPYIALETRVEYDEYAPEGFGTADCIIIGGDTLHLIDFKYGVGVPVEVADNSQLKLYAAGAIKRYSPIYNIEKVVLHIVQPRAGGTSQWEMTKAELMFWCENVVAPTAFAAFNGIGDLAGGPWCRFCPVKFTCKERSGQYLALDDFGQKEPELYTFEELGEILTRARGLKAWANEIEEYALASVLRGEHIPGYKAVEGRSTRAFDDQEAAFAALISFGIREELLYERKALTLAATEKLVGKKSFAEICGDHIITPPGKPTLVPETDKRPAINSVAADFGPQENENDEGEPL